MFRLVMIAISAMAVVALVVFALRMTGEKQTFAVPPHPLYEIKPFEVAWGGDSSAGPAFSLPAYKAAASRKEVLGAALHVSRDGTWFVAASNQLAKITDGTGFLTKTDATDLTKLKYKSQAIGLLKFSELVKALPASFYFVTIENPATPYLESIFKIIESAGLEEHFVISSPFADTARLVRERNPKWFTGATTAETARAEFMSSLFLEPLLNMESEAFVADAPRLPSEFRLLKEMRKRHILTLIRSNDVALVHDLLAKDLISGSITTAGDAPPPH